LNAQNTITGLVAFYGRGWTNVQTQPLNEFDRTLCLSYLSNLSGAQPQLSFKKFIVPTNNDTNNQPLGLAICNNGDILFSDFSLNKLYIVNKL